MRCQKLLSNSSIKNFSLYTPCTVCVCCVCLFFGWPVMMPLISRFCIRTFGTNGNKMRAQKKQTASTNNTWTIIARRFCSQQRTLRNSECSLESFLWMPCATMGIFEMLFIFLLQVRISKQHLKCKKIRFKVFYHSRELTERQALRWLQLISIAQTNVQTKHDKDTEYGKFLNEPNDNKLWKHFSVICSTQERRQKFSPMSSLSEEKKSSEKYVWEAVGSR